MCLLSVATVCLRISLLKCRCLVHSKVSEKRYVKIYGRFVGRLQRCRLWHPTLTYWTYTLIKLPAVADSFNQKPQNPHGRRAVDYTLANLTDNKHYNPQLLKPYGGKTSSRLSRQKEGSNHRRRSGKSRTAEIHPPGRFNKPVSLRCLCYQNTALFSNRGECCCGCCLAAAACD